MNDNNEKTKKNARDPMFYKKKYHSKPTILSPLKPIEEDVEGEKRKTKLEKSKKQN